MQASIQSTPERGCAMNRLPIAGLLILMLLVVSGYVSSGTSVANDAVATPTVAHLDPHVGYYQQHLAAMGVR